MTPLSREAVAPFDLGPEAAAVRIGLQGTVLRRAVVAAQALRKLVRDPDDLAQVWILDMVANAGVFPHLFLRLATTDDGERIIREQPSIDRAHVDLDALRALPADTLGGAFARYLDDNGLDLGVFHPPPGVPTMIAYMSKRVRQMHDILHVLAEYRPDIAGEVALQAFTYGQTGKISAALIAFAGVLGYGAKAPGIAWMALDGWRRGRRSPFLYAIRWEDHWHRKLDDLRREFGVLPRRAPEIFLATKKKRGSETVPKQDRGVS